MAVGFTRLIKDIRAHASRLGTGLAAIFFGGVLGPVLLLFGLIHISGWSASLLLNLEAVMTALIAWAVFRENTDRRVMIDMIAIVTGGIILPRPSGMCTVKLVGLCRSQCRLLLLGHR